MHANINDFIIASTVELNVPPGGNLPANLPHFKDASLYLYEVAFLLSHTPNEDRISVLHRKIDQLNNQYHFDAATDKAVTNRLCQWIGELVTHR